MTNFWGAAGDAAAGVPNNCDYEGDEDESNLPKIKSISNLLLDQAKLLEGIPLDDSKDFCDKLNDLLLQTIK